MRNIYGKFAKTYGFGSHAGWKKSKSIVEPDEPYEEKFTFGSFDFPLDSKRK